MPSTTTKTKSAAKSTAATTTTTPKVRLSEEEKSMQPLLYILNTSTKKHVLRTSDTGKKIIQAEADGVELVKPMTDSERLIEVVQRFQDRFKISNLDIKDMLEDIMHEMPKVFPDCWGGSKKTSTKIPGKPTKFVNVYFMYSAERRRELAKDPEVKSSDINDIISKEWAEIKEELAKPVPNPPAIYHRLKAEADKDMLRYKAEMDAFDAANPQHARSPPKSDKPTKTTAYRQYGIAEHARVAKENKDFTPAQITQKLSEEWSIVKEDKAKCAVYEEMAKKENAGFAERFKKYYDDGIENGTLVFSTSEQAKAEKPEKYTMNYETGKFVEIKEPKGAKGSKGIRTKKVAITKKTVEELTMTDDEEEKTSPRVTRSMAKAEAEKPKSKSPKSKVPEPESESESESESEAKSGSDSDSDDDMEFEK